MYGIDYLRQKLGLKQTRVKLRYDYYEMKEYTENYGISMPDNLKHAFKSVSGWCAKAVDCLADRLIFSGFDNDDFYFNEIINLNNPDVLCDSAILSALISSCCFIYISQGEDKFPRLQVIDGYNATGIIDEITGLLSEGYAVLKRNDYGKVLTEAYFTSENTIIYDYENGTTETYKNVSGVPLLVPIIYRPDAMRPFGHSRISRACMYLQKVAKRTLQRSEVSAEFYSYPQKYVIGLSQDAEPLDSWRAVISSMLVFQKDDDGDKPTLGQFSQQSMAPYTEQLKTIASAFAGETGLTLDDLGFVSDNPSSAEAIKAGHENLRLTARKAQRTFGRGFLNACYLASCVRDDYPYKRSQMYKAIPKWQPIFEPDASMLSQIGDGAIKINQAIPGYFNSKTLKELTGINGGEDDNADR